MRVVFDIETELFCDEFRKTNDNRTRFRLAPSPRLACAYIVEKKKYYFFTPDNFRELNKLLFKASEVITFNGENFDFLVLCKYLKLKKKELFKGKSFDLFSHVSKKAGFRVSLDQLSRLNLGEGKKIKGKMLGTAPINILKDGCKSDVTQTYNLWKLYLDGGLDIPDRRFWKDEEDEFDCNAGPGQMMPNECPKCGGKNTLVFIFEPEDYIDQLTDGQMTEYIAGTWGSAICTKCNKPITWEG